MRVLNRKHIPLIIFAILASALGNKSAAQSANRETGRTRSLIVFLPAAPAPVQNAPEAAGGAVIGAAPDDFGAALDEVGVEVRRFADVPYALISANSDQLALLQKTPGFRGAEEPEISTPLLDQSVPLIGAPDVWKAGFTGTGQTIAIVDTGVDVTHKWFEGRIVAQACFSTGFEPDGSTSLCGDPALDSNPGNDCPDAISGCGHGTHVASIAAGSDGVYRGVAPSANIIAIKAFSRFDDAPGGPTPCSNVGLSSPCALSYRVDQIRALNYVASIQSKYHIAAVNMSLGGGRYGSVCDDASDQLRLTKKSIDTLRAGGTATVVAAGNAGYKDALAAPACISTAFAVGNTPKSDDSVRGTSDSATFLQFLAPGTAITAAKSGGGATAKSGTSMAAPHVAGAWALLMSAKPTATVDEIANILSHTGKMITDSGNGIAKPRIDALAAEAALVSGQVMDAASSTQSTVTSDVPSVAGASSVQIFVRPDSSPADNLSTAESLAQSKERVMGILKSHGIPVTSSPGTHSITSFMTPDQAAEALSIPGVVGIERSELSQPY
ncbi:S8 family peptidase [Rhizobium leguminosarum]|uniref:S8 family peptidase n=1 Tax=Rhizobium leguminosarum TaxID=384 RepID=UPI001C987156|nr:S8 family serine peptidase [Rhizobium leguminosarum]MBY5809239.1 S8 family serine peptidase [Rhizobium leguminosarum]